MTPEVRVTPSFDQQIEVALRADSPWRALRELAIHMLHRGLSRDEALAEFDRARNRLHEEGRAADEDAVMDAMDILSGWCAPHAIIPEPCPGASTR